MIYISIKARYNLKNTKILVILYGTFELGHFYIIPFRTSFLHLKFWKYDLI